MVSLWSQYYASGVPMAESTGRDQQPYLYNGKEFVEAHGWHTYDYGFRGYYAPIGRFTSIDPQAEKYYHISPYSWCGNNPVNAVDPDGMDTVSVTYNLEKNTWELETPIISQGKDVIRVTDKGGKTSNYIFSEGEYGKRADFLNLENTGEEGVTFGVYHVSGAKEAGTGFFVTPGGMASNDEKSGRRIMEDIYPIVAPFKQARWLFPGVGGSVVESRGVRFHWGDGIAKKWTDGCFVLFTNYILDNSTIRITENNSKIAAVNFARLLGGVGTANSTYKGRTGVLCFPYGIQDKLILKSTWKR